MVCATDKEAAKQLGELFQTEGEVQKEYVARVAGCFPEWVPVSRSHIPEDEESHREETVCTEPLLAIDRQLGLNAVHAGGRVRPRSSSQIEAET